MFPCNAAPSDGEDGGVAEVSRGIPDEEGGEVDGNPTAIEIESSASKTKRSKKSERVRKNLCLRKDRQKGV